jgi:hypothetical protein
MKNFTSRVTKKKNRKLSEKEKTNEGLESVLEKLKIELSFK